MLLLSIFFFYRRHIIDKMDFFWQWGGTHISQEFKCHNDNNNKITHLLFFDGKAKKKSSDWKLGPVFFMFDFCFSDDHHSSNEHKCISNWAPNTHLNKKKYLSLIVRHLTCLVESFFILRKIILEKKISVWFTKILSLIIIYSFENNDFTCFLVYMLFF